MFHAAESVPEHDSTLTTAPTSVTIEHYGPVAEGDTQDTDPPVRVYESPAYFLFCSGYTDHDEIPLCYLKCQSFTDYYWTRKTGFDISVSGRTVTVANGSDTFRPGHAYEIIPDDLVCDIAGDLQLT